MTSIALAFPGQGSQRAGMSHDFYESSEVARRVFEVASEAAEMDIARLCFSGDPRLDQTEYSQPAILTAEIAALSAIREHLNGEPEYFGGHSLGEYTALVAADVLSLDSAIRIVVKRGQLMQQATAKDGGGMLALIQKEIESTDYRTVVTECSAEVANFNSPEQVVVSGSHAALDALSGRLAAEFPEIRVVRLAVSAPFHSTLMSRVQEEFGEFLRAQSDAFRVERASRVLSNVTGGFHSPELLIDNLIRQISGAVQWRLNMSALCETGAAILEIGPTRVLSKLLSDAGISATSITDLRTLQRYCQSTKR